MKFQELYEAVRESQFDYLPEEHKELFYHQINESDLNESTVTSSGAGITGAIGGAVAGAALSLSTFAQHPDIVPTSFIALSMATFGLLGSWLQRQRDSSKDLGRHYDLLQQNVYKRDQLLMQLRMSDDQRTMKSIKNEIKKLTRQQRVLGQAGEDILDHYNLSFHVDTNVKKMSEVFSAAKSGGLTRIEQIARKKI